MRIIHVPLDNVRVSRDTRQRRDLSDIPALAESITRHGLLNPIVVTDDFTLIAGERRLAAFRYLSRPTIPAQLLSDLSKEHQHEIELEENIRREDLPWPDRVNAIGRYADMIRAADPDATSEYIGSRLGISRASIQEQLTVYSAIKEDPKLAEFDRFSTALGTVVRRRERMIESVVENIGRESAAILSRGTEESTAVPAAAPSAAARFFTADFLTLLPTYRGERFNFLHCDFPYGVRINDSDQNESARFTTYTDTKELYFELCNCLAEHLPRILAPSAHVFFWFSMTYYHETVELFTKRTDLFVNPFPCVWVKSDNKGILPDATRGPRRIYETALLMSRGDRKIVKSVGNAYSAPSASERTHLSEKPVPVLRHFFQMFVDEFTTIFDPTCGSGNALIAADTLGAQTLVAADINPENVELAKANFRRHERLKHASKGA